MSRRGGFRSSGGSDDGFRLLPKSWAGRPADGKPAGKAASDSGDPTKPQAAERKPQSARPAAAKTGAAASGSTAAGPARSSAGSGARPAAAGGGTGGAAAKGTVVAAGGGGGGMFFWGGLALGGLGVIAICAFAGFYLFTHLVIGLKLQDQPGSIYLPPEFDAVANITNTMDLIMDGVITAQVPFKQTLDLPLKGRYTADVKINAPVPIKFNVAYDGTIPVDTFADITARANFNFQDIKSYRQLEIKAKLPMKMALPVKLNVPVDTTLDFKYEGPLVMGLDQTIQAPVDTVLNTSLRVNQKVSTPVSAAIPLHIHAPKKPLNIYLHYADLKLNADTLRLEVADDNEGPKRTESPWGPPAKPPEQPRAGEAM